MKPEAERLTLTGLPLTLCLDLIGERPITTMQLLARRISNSTVVWSWGFNFLRLASGLLLLPLLLKVLSRADLGMYYTFLSLNAIVVVLDLGFSPTVGRFINYAMGGAKRLSVEGLAAEEPHGEPNFKLLWELLFTARMFYRFVALATVVLMGTLGSLLVWYKAAETSSAQITWMAWGISIAAVGAEAYFSVWNVFLRNINQVLAATRIGMLAYASRVGLASILLLCGGGLLSLPIASLATSIIIRNLSRKRCLEALERFPAPEVVDWRAHLGTIWPNSWKLGLYFGGGYLATNANVILCSTFFGLEANANYGLSMQIVSIVSGMAAVWTAVKWPLVGQLIARQSLEELRKVLWPRLWLQLGTYVLLASAALLLGPELIRRVGSDKQMLPMGWMLLLVVNGMLEAHCSVWNTLISMWNRLPMLWPSLATNVVALGMNLILIQVPNSKPGFLVLGPLLASAAVNYWFWPIYGARTLNLTWLEFVRYGFSRQKLSLSAITTKPLG